VLRDGRVTAIDKDALLAEIEAALQRPPSEAEAARRAFVKALDPHLRAFYADWPFPEAADAFRAFNARR
jgi:hypothetical protein